MKELINEIYDILMGNKVYGSEKKFKKRVREPEVDCDKCEIRINGKYTLKLIKR